MSDLVKELRLMNLPISHRAADEIERLTTNVRRLHDATFILRRGMGGHNHWDRTMKSGSGCQVCIDQRKAKAAADKLIDAVA